MKEIDVRSLTPKDLGLRASERVSKPPSEGQRGEGAHKEQTVKRRALQPPVAPVIREQVHVKMGQHQNKEKSAQYQGLSVFERDHEEWLEREYQRKQALYAEKRKKAEIWEAKQKALDENWPKIEANLNARLKHPDGTWKKRLPKGWMILTNNGWAEGYETPYHKLLFAHRDFVYRFPSELHPLANYLFWKERFGPMTHVQPPEMLQGMDEGVLAFLFTLVFELINSKDHPQTKLPNAA